MLILGIDPGLANTGWSLVDSHTARLMDAGYLATRKAAGVGDAQARLTDVLDELAFVVSLSQLVVVEWPGMGGARVAGKMNAMAASQTVAAAAGALGLARGMGKRVLSPAPMTWRCALGAIRGQDEGLHATFTRMYPATVARFNKGQRPHVLDAIGLALFGRLTLQDYPPLRNAA